MKINLHHCSQAGSQAALPRVDPVNEQISEETDPIVHGVVEDYLDRVCRPLIETHSYHVRFDLRQELAQHIRSLIRAYEEMGDTPIVAAEKALAKFGEADTVARQWKLPAPTNRRKPVRRWFRQQWQGIAATLAMCSIAMAICGGVSLRTLSSQQAAARAQNSAAQPQVSAIVANAGYHRDWAAHHQCTECHRSGPILNVRGSLGVSSLYWRLPPGLH